MKKNFMHYFSKVFKSIDEREGYSSELSSGLTLIMFDFCAVTGRRVEDF